MKRVLSIATLFPNAHQPRFGTFVARQMEALAKRDDWDVHVINPLGMPPVAMGRYARLLDAAISGRENGVNVHRPRFTLIPAVGGPFNPAMIVRAALPLARRLHAIHPFDLVDAQFFYPDGPAAARIAEELGLPLSIKARGADISLWGHKAYANRKMRAAAAQAKGLLAVSEALKRDMVAIGLPEEKITVHYTGLDQQRFRPQDRARSRAALARDHGVPIEGPLLASVGALIPRKGQHFVIEALAELPDAQLVLVGEGPDESDLRALAAMKGLAGRVHFLGSLNHDGLPKVLSAAEAMVLPSASEGLANAWVEALACGTPLVITDVGGARELVTSDTAGRIVARETPAILQGIGEVLAANYAPADVAQCAARFSWDNNAAALGEYYERLLA
ncbi:glycosyltransferase [Alteraurantiacibacter aquimixticola]|uniref:Glycosyltransferase family 4 protein n=1 Tax=Alteraurantiacibacter aquimixticola TaxID=2489173 RepID=A0A4T3F438_9SPHN|nr:glycosyltransferase [Alteraurantiacibacter aquimixticola]TIX51908.1 glycosyltransferase family 4 protein [Alteraurantiacibacter aquimixticola]